MESLELSVKILLVIFAISERMQADSVLVVRCHVLKLDSVPALLDVWRIEWNFLTLESCFVCEGLVVDGQISDCHGLRIKEELSLGRKRFEIKVDHCFAKIVIALLQCQLEIVLHVLDQLLPPLSLSLRQGDTGLELLINNRAIAKVLQNEAAFRIAGFENFVCFNHLDITLFTFKI